MLYGSTSVCLSVCPFVSLRRVIREVGAHLPPKNVQFAHPYIAPLLVQDPRASHDANTALQPSSTGFEWKAEVFLGKRRGEVKHTKLRIRRIWNDRQTHCTQLQMRQCTPQS